MAIEQAYESLEGIMLNIMGSIASDLQSPQNLARANPSLIVKIVRIMEVESHFEQSLRSQAMSPQVHE